MWVPGRWAQGSEVTGKDAKGRAGGESGFYSPVGSGSQGRLSGHRRGVGLQSLSSLITPSPHLNSPSPTLVVQSKPSSLSLSLSCPHFHWFH